MADPTPGVHYDTAGKKYFVPLENHPAVFADLATRLGATPSISFHDVYSIDEPELRALIPRPVHALIFIAPAVVYYRVRRLDASGLIAAPGTWWYTAAQDESVNWFRQTIGNACGLMSLIHALANGTARKSVSKGSLIDRIIKEARPLDPTDRAQLLYDSPEIEQAHMSVASKGDTSAPDAASKVTYHFITFCKGQDGHLYELEGSKDAGGPLDLGPLPNGVDMLDEPALKLGVRRYIDAAQGNADFSIVALAERSARIGESPT